MTPWIVSTGLMLAMLGSSALAQQQVVCIGVSPDVIAAMAKAGGKLAQGDAKALPDGGILVWQVGGKETEITADRALKLGEFVRQGGALLISFDDGCGASPSRLAFMMPTVAWRTKARSGSSAGVDGSVGVGEADPEMFGQESPKVVLPYCYPVRLIDAVERGEQRYEILERSLPTLDLKQKAGEHYWTRPLLNRDWRIRLRGDDVGHTPLLATGRYGAGRVAVLGCAVSKIEGTPDSLLKPLLAWLGDTHAVKAAAGLAQTIQPVVTVDSAARSLKVVLKNPQPQAMKVEVLARLSTWERALMGDVTQLATIPANGELTVELPLPKSGVANYQALDFRDALDVRVGVISADGAVLLSETHQGVDLRPDLTLSVAGDNIRTLEYPFHAPGFDERGMANRLGTPVSAYAYKPGATIAASVTLRNACRNLAMLAKVQDQTQPDNPTTFALTDEAAMAEQGPIDGITGYGQWTGRAGEENVLSFSFPNPVTLSAVVLNGAAKEFRNQHLANPGAAIVEIDGKQVAAAADLDKRFVDQLGLPRLAFAPTTGKVVRIRLPWLAKIGEKNRSAPKLAEVQLFGTAGVLPVEVKATVALALVDAMTGETLETKTQAVTLSPCSEQVVTLPLKSPADSPLRVLRLEAKFGDQQAVSPILVINPQRTILPNSDNRPPDSPAMGFIVTRGFRNCFDLGTGTQEIPPKVWGTPDDLVWAYSRQLKQTGRGARTMAGKLYVTEDDMRHYSTPWRFFNNGEYFYDVAAPSLLDRLKKHGNWNKSEVAVLGHSDRWDTGPDLDTLHQWSDFVEFDRHLRSQGKPALVGKTRQEVADDIHNKHENQWMTWQLERYTHAIHLLKETFAKEGKRLLITSQGTPMMPAQYQEELAQVIRGMGDDSTWGMWEESIPMTTGRQMAGQAYNPVWAMSECFVWGYDSGQLDNPHWHTAVGTTEPSRRHQYDRAFRGMVGPDGVYGSMHTYGYGTNAGMSYTMTENDWQQSWNVQERHSLLYPESPIGVGLVVGTGFLSNPDHVIFAGASAAPAVVRGLIMTVAKTMRRLHDAGVGVSFTTNVAALDKWTGNAPLIVLNPEQLNDAEAAALKKLIQRGVPVVAMAPEGPLPAGMQSLFGMAADGSSAADAKASTLAGHAVVTRGRSILIRLTPNDLTPQLARRVASTLRETIGLPIQFPDGTAGYGFTCRGKSFIVVEDWMELGRTVSVRLHANPQAKAAWACDINDHRTLQVRREGADWVIDLPLRPADANIICVEESL